MSGWKPTGKRRHRTMARCLRRTLLVLQIEETCTMDRFVHPGDVETYEVVRWRDATAGDVTTGVA